jgi:4-amino-4-deoxy-L-arabinose transferase-like glycosyltransferase
LLKRPNIAIFLLAALGLTLRLYRLDHLSLWLDEATSIEQANRPAYEILYSKGFDSHTPPFYYLLLHYWFAALPPTAWGLRLLSALIDTGSILLVYAAFSRLFKPNKSLALITAGLYTFSPFAIYYAQEGRMYSLVMFLVSVAFYCAIRLRDNELRWEGALLLLCCCVSGVYTHYYFILFLAALTLAILLDTSGFKGKRLYWLGLMFLVGLCFLPWLKVVLSLAASEGQTFRRFTLSVIPYAFFRFSAGYAVLPLNYNTKDNIPQALLAHWPELSSYFLFFGLLSLWSLAKLRKSHPQTILLLLLPLFLPAAIALLISIKVPMLGERYLCVSFPFFIALLASGLQDLKEQPWGRIAACLSILFFIYGTAQYYFNPSFGKTEWKQAATVISQRDPEAPLFFRPDHVRGLLDYYLPRTPKHCATLLARSSAAQLGPGLTYWLIERGTETSLIHELVPLHAALLEEQLFPLENGIRLFYLRNTASRPLAHEPQ